MADNIFGTHEKGTLAQLAEVEKNAVQVALMADGHLGYVMPIGGVAAYDNKVSVVGVGYDIACGNAAIRTDKRFEDFDARALGELADEIHTSISFGVGRSNKADDAPTDDPLFESPSWDAIPAHTRNTLRAKAREQLGTIGSGNHYVDVFHDEQGRMWVGVHFGSRGLGHNIATGFMGLAVGEKWGTKVKEQETLLDLDTPLGHDYWHAMELAGRYAYVGREWVARKVMRMFGGTELDLVHNHHNFAWKEVQNIGGDGDWREVVVVRKGATPAFPGQRGFIGGSMGDDAVIVEGTDCDKLFGPSVGHDWSTAHRFSIHLEQQDALFSTVHGAGRVMGRADAIKGRAIRDERGIPTGERDLSTKVTPEMQMDWVDKKGVILRGSGVDESPHAYRRLPDVLAAQGQTIQVLHTLTPVVVVMADAKTKDPYKD